MNEFGVVRTRERRSGGSDPGGGVPGGGVPGGGGGGGVSTAHTTLQKLPGLGEHGTRPGRSQADVAVMLRAGAMHLLKMHTDSVFTI